MKKLYQNIEDIHIKGDISELSSVVTAIDISLQNISEYTERLFEVLAKYGTSNKGAQYEKVVNTASSLRDVVYQASVDLNDMQNQVVAYQNKIYRYEEIAASAGSPNPHLVTRRQISVNTATVQFNRSDMVNVAAMLQNYSEQVFHHLKTIAEKKNDIAHVWQDSQYTDFSEFIDSVGRDVIEAIKVFEDYISFLEDKIKELG